MSEKKKLSKHDKEQYALLVSSHILGIDRARFQLGERPDIRNEIDSIGIEVVEAMTEVQGQIQDLVRTYYGKGKKGNEVKQEIQAKHPDWKVCVTVTEDNNFYIWEGTRDSRIGLEILQDKILKKDEKLKEYTKFKLNYLFAFLHSGIYRNDEIEKVLDNVFSMISYDGIIVSTMNGDFLKTKGKIIRYDFSEKKEQFIAEIVARLNETK